MRKVDGVEKVEVRLSDGMTILDLKAGDVVVKRATDEIRNGSRIAPGSPR